MHKIAGNLFDLKRNEINSKFEIRHQKIDFVCKVSFLEENPIKTNQDLCENLILYKKIR